MKFRTLTLLAIAAMAAVASLLIGGRGSHAATNTGPIRAGFETHALAATDDGSFGAVALPFAIDLNGASTSDIYINANGSLTFDQPLWDFTPFALTDANQPIIAPFFSDVDTLRGGAMSYGTGTVDGHPAFAVTWQSVSCYAFGPSPPASNDFQVVLIDRSDTGKGNFDIEFNYGKIQWESGQASGGNAHCLGGIAPRAGYSTGSGQSVELRGSGEVGAFLDTNATGGLARGDLGSPVPGRYVFPIRTHAVGTDPAISGRVFASSSAEVAVADASVRVCTSSGVCRDGVTNGQGQFDFTALAVDTYNLTVVPPAGSGLGTVYEYLGLLRNGETINLPRIVLSDSIVPPAGTSIVDLGSDARGLPLVSLEGWHFLNSASCPGGVATYAVSAGAQMLDQGTMFEGATGYYAASFGSVYTKEHLLRVSIVVRCPNGHALDNSFDIDVAPASANQWTLTYSYLEPFGPTSSASTGGGTVTPTPTPTPEATSTPTATGATTTPTPVPTATPAPSGTVVQQSTTYNATPTAGGPAGVYTITATFTNTSGQTISSPYFVVTAVTNGDLLLNADGGPGGVGATLTPSNAALGGDGQVSPGESVTQVFKIGLASTAPFTFRVDVRYSSSSS